MDCFFVQTYSPLSAPTPKVARICSPTRLLYLSRRRLRNRVLQDQALVHWAVPMNRASGPEHQI
ncbi:hypothetical protein WG66_003558 [Moniliophthora roreri]|nr:hypothetical protein WG66_003558 [Moniliophthora roreri]